jgi:lysophospholipase L1-like esterase
MDVQAGEQSVFAVHCNSHGCGNWNSGYNLFTLDSSVGGDRISYQPQTSMLTMNFGSTGYSFSPQGFTATTINAGTVNATTLNGTVSAGQLPLFVGSGSGHEPGAVPDPGATAGSTRYLREDGTWAVPADGVASGQSAGGGSTGSGATIAGATADYNFLQGSGTTLTDSTGNGNNGTLGAGTAAPTWTSSGLEFSIGQNVALPSALNASRTVSVAFYSSPGAVLNANNIAGGIATFVTSSLGAGGLNLFATDFDGPNGTQIPTVESGSNVGTVSSVAISGFNVLTYTVGNSSSDLDHVYLNGVELPYASQTFSGGSQSSGFLYLGTSNISPFSNIGLVGTMYRAVFETSEDTPAQVAANYQAIVKDMNSRGVAMTPQSQPIGKPTLYAVGDSITFGLGVTASQAWPLNLALTNQPAYTIVNAGIPSQSVRSIAGSEPNRIAPFCANSAGPTVAILLAGTNDVGPYGYTAAQAFASTVSFVTKMRKAGCLVFAGTMISRGSSDAAKDSFDALLLDGMVRAGANGVVDFAANPLLGADGANTNATYFQADNIHPTSTGQLLLSAAASNALNYYFGSNSSNPTVVTATHTIAAGEGYITATPTANATLTLPDCTGQSGAIYTVSNTQSAFTVGVVTGSSAQLINGIAAGTAVSVPSNSSVSFRDVPNPKTVSGCHWEK